VTALRMHWYTGAHSCAGFLLLAGKMFYSTQILARKGPLGIVWIAAHKDLEKLTRHQVRRTSACASDGQVLSAVSNSAEMPAATLSTSQLQWVCAGKPSAALKHQPSCFCFLSSTCRQQIPTYLGQWMHCYTLRHHLHCV
jgi:hypothetical protein